MGINGNQSDVAILSDQIKSFDNGANKIKESKGISDSEKALLFVLNGEEKKQFIEEIKNKEE